MIVGPAVIGMPLAFGNADFTMPTNISTTATNTPPRVNSFTITMVENRQYYFDISDFEDHFNANDLGQKLESIRFTTLPSKGSLYLYNSLVKINQQINRADISKLRYIPYRNEATVFRWSGNDGVDWSSNTSPIFVKILNEPEPPVLSDILISVPKDSVVRITRNDFISHIEHQLEDAFQFDSLRINTIPLDGNLYFNGILIKFTPKIIRGTQFAENQFIEFVPKKGTDDTLSFRWNASDGYHTSKSDASVIIDYYNTPPVFKTISRKNLKEDQPQSGFRNDIIANYSDRDKFDTLRTITLVTLPPPNEGQYYFANQPITTANFTIDFKSIHQLKFQPALGFEGTTTSIWSAYDGSDSDTTQVHLTFINTPPIVHTINLTGYEDSIFSFTDKIFNQRYKTGPFEDTDISDLLDSIKITLLPTNGVFLFNGDSLQKNFSLPASAIDQLSFSPKKDWFGTDFFRYNAFDGTDWAKNDSNAIIKIQPVNDPPRLQKDHFEVNEDNLLFEADLTQNDTDIDDLKTSLTYSVDENDSLDAGANGTISLQKNGLLTYSPKKDYNGTVTFVYSVCDKIACSKDTVTIKIFPVNDAPVASPDNYSISENDVLTGVNCIKGIPSFDWDVDGDSIHLIDVSNNKNGTVVGKYGILKWQPSGELTFTPNIKLDSLALGEIVKEEFSYIISDTPGETDTTTLTITITGTNDNPVAQKDVFKISEGAISIDHNDFWKLLKNDSDIDSDSIWVSALNNSANENYIVGKYGSFIWGTDGTWHFYQDNQATNSLKQNQIQTVLYPYTISDTWNAIGESTVAIEIVGVNDAPVAANDFNKLYENQLGVASIDTTKLIFNDIDPDNDKFKVIEVKGDQYGSVKGDYGILQWRSDGFYSYTYTPLIPKSIAEGDTIFDVFKYTIRDDFNAMSSAKLTVAIIGLNDDPTANNDFKEFYEDHLLNKVDSIDGLLRDTLSYDIDLDPIIVAVNNDSTKNQQIGQFGMLNWYASGAYEYELFKSVVDTLFQGERVPDIFEYTILDQHKAKSSAYLVLTVIGQNDAPVAVNHETFMMEDDSSLQADVRTQGILKESWDIDDNEFFGIVEVNGKNSPQINGRFGVLNWNYDGTFTYKLNDLIDTLYHNEVVTDYFQFKIKDRFDSTAQAWFTIQITGENDFPHATDDYLNVTEDDLTIEKSTKEESMLYNDYDIDRDYFYMNSFNAETQNTIDAKFASFTWNSIGSYTYNRYVHSDPRNGLDTLAFGDFVVDSIPYTIIDNRFLDSTFIQLTDTAFLRLKIKGINDAPVAQRDTVSLFETSHTISRPIQNGLLSNDYDVDRGDSIYIATVNNSSDSLAVGQFGALNWDKFGAFSYTIDSTATDTLAQSERVIDTFSYKISDKLGIEAIDTLEVTIIGINDPPVATPDYFYILEDESITTIPSAKYKNILVNDYDLDGDSIYVTFSNNAPNQSYTGIYGKLDISSTGHLVYTLNPGIDSLYIGEIVTESFTYQIADVYNAQAIGQIFFVIEGQNDPPTPVEKNTYIYEDIDTTTIQLIAENEVDIDGDAIFLKLPTNPTPHELSGDYGKLRLFANGISEYILKRSNSSLPFGKTVTDSFYYEISDIHDAISPGKVNIHITGNNDRPNALNDTLSIFEDDTIGLLLPSTTLLSNDTDPDGDEIKVVAIKDDKNQGVEGLNGYVDWNSSGEVVFTPSDYIHQLAPGQVFYEPFLYSVSDKGDLIAHADLIIKITGQNDPLTCFNDTVQVEEDGYIKSIGLKFKDVDNFGLGNFDFSTLTLLEKPVNGKAFVNTAMGTLSYFPDKDYFGKDSLHYSVCDDGGSCSNAWIHVNVKSINDAPIATHLTVKTTQNNSIEFNVLSQVEDVDDTLMIEDLIIKSKPKYGTVAVNDSANSLTYTPQKDFTGTDELIYSLADPAGEKAFVIVTVLVHRNETDWFAHNDTISILEDNAVDISILSNDTLTSGQIIPLSFDLSVFPKNGSAKYDSVNQSVVYTPQANYFGTDEFTYSVCTDNGICDMAKVVVNVLPVNDQLIAVDDAAETIQGNTVTIALLDNDFDLESYPAPSTLHFTQMPDSAQGVFEIDSIKGYLTFTAAVSFTGTAHFSYTICDTTDLNTQTCSNAEVTILVKPSEQKIWAKNDFFIVDENQSLLLEPLLNDSVALGFTKNPNSFVIVEGPQNGSFDSTFNYKPKENYFGPDLIVYQICADQPEGGCDLGEINIWVNEINQPPTVRNDVFWVLEKKPKRMQLLANDDDIDGNIDFKTLQLTTPANTLKGTVSVDNNTGTIIYTPKTNTATENIAYRVCDNKGACSNGVVMVNVDLGSTLPYNQITQEDTPDTIDLLPLMEAYNLNFIISSSMENPAPEHGTWQLASNNTKVVYAPNKDYFGKDSYSLKFCDNSGSLCAKLQVQATILPVNDAPIANTDSLTWEVENKPLIIAFEQLLLNDTDIENDTLSIVPVIGNHSNSQKIAVDTDGTFTITSDSIIWCDAWFEYKLTDKQDTVIGKVIIIPILEGVVANVDTFSLDENTQTAFDILKNDLFKDQQRCVIDTVFIVTNPQNGAAASNEANFIDYRPKAHFYGIDSLRYAIVDIWGQADTAWVHIDVIERNTPPAAINDTIEANYDVDITIWPLNNDYDPDPDGTIDTLRTNIYQQPSSGTVWFNKENFTFEYTPYEMTCENDQFSYTIFDNEGDSAMAIVVINLPKEAAISIIPDTVKTWPGVPVEFHPLTNDRGFFYPSIEGFSQTFSNSGTTSQLNDSTLIYYPNPEFFNRDSLEYTIASPCGNTTTGIVIFDIIELRVPEIITPNGDGKNDVLIIDGIDYFPDALLQIYNRYGHVVFQKKGYNNDWGGSSNRGSFLADNSLPSGQYYYTLTYNEKRNKQAGSIYIYR
jgi:gliding motility-associated-like protein